MLLAVVGRKGVNISDLTSFLAEASLPHATGKSNATRMPDDSTTITFKQGHYSFHDNFFGGTPYGGRAVIHFKGKPVWMMVYYGQVHSTSLDRNVIYDFLRLALQHAPKDGPARGPRTFTKANWQYRSILKGDMASYSGQEVILHYAKEIYWAKYMGGVIDQEHGVGF